MARRASNAARAVHKVMMESPLSTTDQKSWSDASCARRDELVEMAIDAYFALTHAVDSGLVIWLVVVHILRNGPENRSWYGVRLLSILETALGSYTVI